MSFEIAIVPRDIIFAESIEILLPDFYRQKAECKLRGMQRRGLLTKARNKLINSQHPDFLIEIIRLGYCQPQIKPHNFETKNFTSWINALELASSHSFAKTEKC